MTLSMWAFLRAIDEEEQRPRWWAFLLAASLGVSLLLKSLIGVVFPVAAASFISPSRASCSTRKSGSGFIR